LLLRIASAGILGSFVIVVAIWDKPIFTGVCLLGIGISVVEWTQMAAKRKLTLALGWVYIEVAGCSLIVLRYDGGWQHTLFLLFTVWATDIAGFAVGKLFGGPKLAPIISPNKTWAGAIGGLYAGAFIALACSGLLNASPLDAMTMGALISIATQLGDLLESAAKRRFGVKDSGWIMPGHGGILDRIDGLLLASLLYSTWYFLISGGQHEF
jgi:phosphatidate cytidylyltransferase